MNTTPSTPHSDGAPAAPKKPYLSPRLEAYGSVGALTAGPFGGISDSFSGGTGGFTQFSP